MPYNQYPFWKDQEISRYSSEARQKQRELDEVKQKLKNVKCPKRGHVFDVE